MDLRFTKMHGLGNDFVVIEDLDGSLDIDPAAVRWLADRNFGVGADGVILVRRPTAADADWLMRYHNADGTTAEMCGNGVRCFVKYVVDHGLVSASADTVAVQTLGGVRRVAITRDGDGLGALATVDMGQPILAAAEIPTTLPGDPVLEADLRTELGDVTVTCVSMGNPHAVVWVDDVAEAPVDTLGPAIETHPAFPNRTNVEFARVRDGATIELRVWERGVGETLACGTGACAVVAAAVLGHRIEERAATVELPGGELGIVWSEEDGKIYMTGPAAEVFTGSVRVPESG